MLRWMATPYKQLAISQATIYVYGQAGNRKA